MFLVCYEETGDSKERIIVIVQNRPDSLLMGSHEYDLYSLRNSGFFRIYERKI